MRTGTAAAASGTPPPTVVRSPAPVVPGASGSQRVAGELILGRYRLIRVIGRGGAGTVWQAEDTTLGRVVAIKCLPSDGSERPLEEARAAAGLGHPTVVGTYGVGVADGCAWLVTEFVAGDTLRRTIAQDTHSDDELLQIGVALCVALRHAHSRGIVHRDVTPRNVLVPVGAFTGPDERDPCHPHIPPAKLADFGIARRAVPGTEEPEPRSGRIVGTLSYMAPERLHGAVGDAAGDLWALAVVLHEAFIGEHPAGGPDKASALVRTHATLPSLGPRRPDLPPVVVDAVDRASAAEPEDRGTVAGLERALRQGLAERGVVVAPVLRVRDSPSARDHRSPEGPAARSLAARRRRRLLLLTLVVAAVLVTIGGAWMVPAVAFGGLVLLITVRGARVGRSRHPVASGDRVGSARVTRY